TRRSGIAQLNHLVATLTAQGANLDLMYLYRTRDTRRIEWQEGVCPAASNHRSTMLKLSTGFPAMQLSDDFARRLRAEDARLSPVDRPNGMASLDDSCSFLLGADSDPRMCGAQRHHLAWDRNAANTVESRAEIASSSQFDTPEVSMIQNFLQTMDQFLS